MVAKTLPTQDTMTSEETIITNTNAVGSSSRQIPIVCPGHTRPLTEIQFCYLPNENRTLMVSACHDRMPMMRDGISGDWIGTFVGHKGAVWSCRLDPTANLAATASGDFSVQVWDAITGKSLYQFQHSHIVKTCDFSPNSRFLATGGHEGLVRIYSILHPKQIPVIIKVNDPTNPKGIAITKINWLSNYILLVGCVDGKIRVYDTSNVANTPTNTILPESTTIPLSNTISTSVGLEKGSEIRDMEISSNKEILTVAAGKTVFFFDLKSTSNYSLIKSYVMASIHFNDEGGVSLHPDGSKFIAGGSDLWVRVFDYGTGTELECLKGHHGPIRCVRYAPDGNLYATGSEDGTIRLWTT
jgi:serine-threonine kinase receptor-associated protein